MKRFAMRYKEYRRYKDVFLISKRSNIDNKSVGNLLQKKIE